MIRGILSAVAVITVVVAIALGGAQVPQPYRAWVIVWVIVGLPLTFAGLAIARQVTDLRRARMEASERNDGRIGAAHPPAAPRPKAEREGLRVIRHDAVSGEGRHIVGRG